MRATWRSGDILTLCIDCQALFSPVFSPKGNSPAASATTPERGETTPGREASLAAAVPCIPRPSCDTITGMDTDKIPKSPRLSRKQIKEALEAVPIEVTLLGATNARSSKLTPKQRAFAEGVAMGKTKAGAYREAYGSKGKPHTASRRGQELAKHGAIQAQIDALKLANEARKYATPAALRALVLERLTAHAIDEDIQPAQRLRALELLGKVTEVAAFTERRELIKTTDAGAARDALLQSLRSAISATSTPIDFIEFSGNKGNSVTVSSHSHNETEDTSATGEPGAPAEPTQPAPTAPHPPGEASAHARALLSIPHTQPTELSVSTHPSQPTNIVPEKLVVANGNSVTLAHQNDADGGGATKSEGWTENSYRETPPSGNWVEK